MILYIVRNRKDNAVYHIGSQASAMAYVRVCMEEGSATGWEILNGRVPSNWDEWEMFIKYPD